MSSFVYGKSSRCPLYIPSKEENSSDPPLPTAGCSLLNSSQTKLLEFRFIFLTKFIGRTILIPFAKSKYIRRRAQAHLPDGWSD